MTLLYVALWGIGVSALLQLQSDFQRGVGTYGRWLPTESAVVELPFAGINVALDQYDSHDERQDKSQDRLAFLRQAGFAWARQIVSWDDIEPQPGVYQWDNTDSVIHSIRAAGLEPVIVLDGSPAWARAPEDNEGAGNPLAPPARLEEFASFAGAFAERYADDVDFYEIWNEPNVAPHWGARWINPVEYAQMLRLASTAIRNVDPNAVILLGALAPTADRGHLGIDEVHFLQRVYAAGAKPYFDAVAIQPFGFGYTPADPTQRLDVLNFQRTQLVRRTMVAAGDAETPMVIVRYGWNREPNSPWATVSPANQTAFAQSALDYAYRNWPWIAGMGWAIDQPNAKPTDPVWGFSLDASLEEGSCGLVVATPFTGFIPARSATSQLVVLDDSGNAKRNGCLENARGHSCPSLG